MRMPSGTPMIATFTVTGNLTQIAHATATASITVSNALKLN